MAAVVLGVPGWEELSCSRRGPWPCDPCSENTLQASNSLHLSKSCLPFRGDLPETALAICLPAGNIPWFLHRPREKGPAPPPPRLALRPFMRSPSPAWSSAPGPRPRLSSHTVPQELGVLPSASLLMLFSLLEMPSPFPPPGKPVLLSSPSVKPALKSTGQATSPAASDPAVLGTHPH